MVVRPSAGVATAPADEEVAARRALQPERHVVAAHDLRVLQHPLFADDPTSDRPHPRRRLAIVDDRWGALDPFGGHRRAEGGGDAAGHLEDAATQPRTRLGIEGPQRPLELDRLWDDVERRAAVDAGHADDGLIHRVGLAQHQGLKRQHQVG